MRSDMSKVIVERPRLRFPLKNGSAYPRGHLKNRWAPHLEDAPRTESMGGTYAVKWLNENLQPLVRFLHSRVGRSWSDVHAEIAAQISARSAVQKHVLDHLRDYVAEHVHMNGETVTSLSRGRISPIESSGMRFRFYVHPDTRRLCLAPMRARRRKYARPDDPDRRVLSREREARRIHGVWYAIDIERIPSCFDAAAACFDVLERAAPRVTARGAGVGTSELWQSGRYAARKRQLDTREIRRLSLARSR